MKRRLYKRRIYKGVGRQRGIGRGRRRSGRDTIVEPLIGFDSSRRKQNTRISIPEKTAFVPLSITPKAQKKKLHSTPLIGNKPPLGSDKQTERKNIVKILVG